MTHIEFGTTTIAFAAATMLALSFPETLAAQPCPGGPQVESSMAWAAWFPASVTCNDGTAVPPAVDCQKYTGHSTPVLSFNWLLATWPDTGIRTMDAVGGCLFMCSTGDCRVGSDGLPVELLHFGVE